MNLEPLTSQWHGSQQALELALAALIGGGHLLIEGPPGTGKSHLSRLLARGFGLATGAVQGTADLMPADVLGSRVLNPGGVPTFRRGPVFCNLLQVDEITRIAPRTLSALLEAMQEGHVTVDGVGHELPQPFVVIATRSTREVEGIYPLPEAALDRFSLSLRLTLPSIQDERALLTVPQQDIATGYLGDLLVHRRGALEIPVANRLIRRAINCVRHSRSDRDLALGAGVRGSQTLVATSRALAWLRGDPVVTLDHLEELVLPVLSHRLRLLEVRGSTKVFVDRHWQQTDPARRLRQRFADGLR